MRQTPYHYHIWYTVCILCDKQPYLDTNVYFLQLCQIIFLYYYFHQLKEKRSIRSRGLASREEQPLPVVMVTRIDLDSMGEVTGNKKPFDSKKNELRSCSTGCERARFVLESRQLALLHVLPCISNVWRAFSPRFSLQCIQFFFPKLCLILKNRFLAWLSSNFQERLLMKYFMPQFIFGVSIFSLRA